MPKSSKPIRTNTIEYDPQKLNNALYILDEIFERVGVKFVLTGRTLKEVLNGQLKSPPIIAVKEKENTRSLRTVLETNLKPLGKNQWEHEGIPIKILWVSNSDRAYDNPDMTYYDFTSYNIPNNESRKRYA